MTSQPFQAAVREPWQVIRTILREGWVVGHPAPDTHFPETYYARFDRNGSLPESQRDSVLRPRVALPALPWVRFAHGHQLQGGCGQSADQWCPSHNPVGVEKIKYYLPRVGAGRQPWALSHNPCGIATPFCPTPLARWLAGLAIFLVAIAASQMSPGRLNPVGNSIPVASNLGGPVVLNGGSPTTTNASSAETLAAQIKAAGFQPASSNQVVAWFADPRRQTQKIVFVDARNEDEYKAGHIPGAWLFDPAHPEKYFTVVQPVCEAAEQVIVYCQGSDCDDSLTAATLLRDIGIPQPKIAVYGAGMDEWLTTGLPVEVGAQNSGKWLKTRP